MNSLDKYLGPEDLVHIAVCTYVRAQYPKVAMHHSPNEGKRGRVAQYKLKKMGVSSGFPDLILIWQGRHLALELKAGDNKATANQKAWIETLRAHGWVAQICTGFDEARAAIDAFVGLSTKRTS